MNNKESIGKASFIDKELEIKGIAYLNYNNVRVQITETWEDFNNPDNNNTTFFIMVENKNLNSFQVISLLPDTLKMLLLVLGACPESNKTIDWFNKALLEGIKIESSYVSTNEVP